MAKSSLRGYWRSKVTSGSTFCTPILSVQGSFDPTSASQVKLFDLPNGAIPLGVDSLGGATGGTNPTVIVGTTVDDNGFADELDADGIAFNGIGALTGISLTTDTAVYGKVGASAATGGTTTVIMKYRMPQV